MIVRSESSPFGSRSRTRVLVALARLGESYPRELARLLGLSLFSVQRALRTLELDALVVARSMGKTRLYQLNPRYFARRDLDRYLKRLADADADLNQAVGALRRRPRRTGKPL
jgi:DNA-binding transcriptional ArsR family regulator